jgi:hypothetical protein
MSVRLRIVGGYEFYPSTDVEIVTKDLTQNKLINQKLDLCLSAGLTKPGNPDF